MPGSAVTAVQPTASPLGNPVTAVSFTPIASTLTANAQAANYVLLRGGQSSPLWGFPTTTASLTVSDAVFEREAIPRLSVLPIATIATINLAGLARSLTPGGLFLLDAAQASGLTPIPAIVRAYSEQFWYANCGANADASTPPASNTPAAGRHPDLDSDQPAASPRPGGSRPARRASRFATPSPASAS